MPISRHSEAIVSPSLSRITNRIRSSITELSFHGILLSAPFGPKSVTHVSGTFCYLCLGTDTFVFSDSSREKSPDTISIECPAAQGRRHEMSTVAVHHTTHLTGIAPQFLVDDLGRAIAYYCDKLGFELAFEYQSFYASVTRDGFAIHLKHATKLAA